MPRLNKIVIDRTGNNALPGNAWESDINLKNSATFYWKVRACSNNSFSDWSAIRVFTTDDAPADPVVSEKSTPVALSTQQPQLVTTLTTTQTQLPLAQSTVNVNLNIPPGILYGGIALIAVILITLMTLAVITIKRHH